MGIRSFLAFELPPDMKDVVYRVSGELKRSSLRARWVKPENIHLTVVFLGSIAPEDLPSIRESTRNVCRGHGPFNVMIRGMGRFGNRRHPRVLWLGLAGDLTQMDAFRDELQDMLRPFGIQREKRVFNPHLTLGRFRKGVWASEELDELMAVYENLKSSVCTLDKLALFKSDLRPDGAVYTQLAEWPLGG